MDSKEQLQPLIERVKLLKIESEERLRQNTQSFKDLRFNFNSTDKNDQGSLFEEESRILAEINRLEGVISIQNEVLEAIKADEYGLCRQCWDYIDLKKLTANPCLIHCTSCQSNIDLRSRNFATQYT
ncbi:hypothetical protein [Vibrio sp. SCSIO 43155]|uniref:hypothetical protein n=1 Tax=Vibrio TaxID=662 RepID=UPI002074B0E6|nr:hypothetical protein [Vibrio sp. SCSIO 43155]USD58559.1 hypothetical protein J4N44_26775 [Vibrio sp. SCSIO 43155]